MSAIPHCTIQLILIAMSMSISLLPISHMLSRTTPLPGAHSPAVSQHAQGAQVAVEGGPEYGRHAVLVGAVGVLTGRLPQQVQVAVPGRLVEHVPALHHLCVNSKNLYVSVLIGLGIYMVLNGKVLLSRVGVGRLADLPSSFPGEMQLLGP